MMKTRLRLGAVLHFIISIGHLACLFFLEEAFKAYDILDEMTSLCCGQTWLLYAVTIVLALAFAVAAIIAIVAVYSLRTVVGLGSLVWHFSFLGLFSSLMPALLVWCYLPGIYINNRK